MRGIEVSGSVSRSSQGRAGARRALHAAASRPPRRPEPKRSAPAPARPSTARRAAPAPPRGSPNPASRQDGKMVVGAPAAAASRPLDARGLVHRLPRLCGDTRLLLRPLPGDKGGLGTGGHLTTGAHSQGARARCRQSAQGHAHTQAPRVDGREVAGAGRDDAPPDGLCVGPGCGLLVDGAPDDRRDGFVRAGRLLLRRVSAVLRLGAVHADALPHVLLRCYDHAYRVYVRQVRGVPGVYV